MPLSPEEREQIEEALIQAQESDDPEIRRVTAEGQLLFRLGNSFQRIDNKIDIDLKYVTCAEYQLFLDDMMARGQFHHPDHWSDYQFPKGDALKPVSGIRPEDAQEFCRWLTRREGGGHRFRLPRSDEASQPFLSKGDEVGAWCLDTVEYKVIGLGDNENKIRKELELILNEPESPLSLLDFDTHVVEAPPVNFTSTFAFRVGVIAFLIIGSFLIDVTLGITVVLLAFGFLLFGVLTEDSDSGSVEGGKRLFVGTVHYSNLRHLCW